MKQKETRPLKKESLQSIIKQPQDKSIVIAIIKDKNGAVVKSISVECKDNSSVPSIPSAVKYMELNQSESISKGVKERIKNRRINQFKSICEKKGIRGDLANEAIVIKGI